MVGARKKVKKKGKGGAGKGSGGKGSGGSAKTKSKKGQGFRKRGGGKRKGREPIGGGKGGSGGAARTKSKALAGQGSGKGGGKGGDREPKDGKGAGGKGGKGGGKGSKGGGKGQGPKLTRKERAAAKRRRTMPGGAQNKQTSGAGKGEKNSGQRGKLGKGQGKASSKAVGESTGRGTSGREKENLPPEDLEGASKPRRVRKRKRGASAKEAPSLPAPKCKQGHSMFERSDNPPFYKELACCDSCGLERLAKRCSSFFHCSFCRWDLCPKCAAKPVQEQQGRKEKAERKAKRRAKEAEEKAAIEKRKATELEEYRAGLARARREVWLPNDATAVSRAPTETKVTTQWQEGMPV